MEQLIIFLLFVIGSIISSIIQNKKKKAEEQQQRELEEMTRRTGGAPPAPTAPRHTETGWPQTAGDWQEQLRRILQGENPQPQPPPVIKPVLLPPVEKQQPPRIPPPAQPVSRRSQPVIAPQTAAPGYQRAAKLHAAVDDRMRAVKQQTATHLPPASTSTVQRPRAQSEFVRRLRRNPRAMREAFIASVIIGPPKSLEDQPTDVR